MRLSHHARLLPTDSLRHREHGYIMVTFALLLVPLLLMVGFAVDIGSWYSRASDMQKAADAAALAGVVWLPDVVKAASYAKEAAARNGFTGGVTVTRVGERQLRVSIDDPAVGSFFYGSITGKKITLTRDGVGEYVLPVPLGSPDNHFGNDPQDSTYAQPNLWGNIHGPKTDNYKGDAYAAGCRTADNCGTTNLNAGFRDKGYLYTIDVKANTTGLDVQVYDAGLYDRGSDESVETGDRKYTGTGTTTTTWTMYKADGTPLSVDDNPIANAALCPAGGRQWTLAEGADEATYKNKWVSICKNTGAIPEGQYLLRVQTSGDGSSANRYSIKVKSTSNPEPRIAGFGDFSMYNNISAGNATTDVTANFYLAEVAPIHKGKIFQVSMYDPGEVSRTGTTTGKGTIKILQPDGSVAANCVPTTDSSTPTFTLGVAMPSCSFDTAIGGSSKYNGSWITLSIPIPNTYSCTEGTLPGCWWKVQYVINGQANDTTTWSAQVIGDPVHLVEN